MIVVGGTKKVTLSGSNDYIQLFTKDELRELFGSEFDPRRLTIITNNGDALISKIPHFYNSEIVLHYYSTTWLHAREFVGKEFAGCYPQVTCLYRERQPNQQTTMISAAEVDSDGYLVIWAYGSGYVSEHMLGVSVSICK